MKNRLALSLCLLALALCVSLPAMAQTTFFTDFATSGNLYNSSTGWTVSGSGSELGEYFVAANEFTSLASGSVSSITLAVGFVENSTFQASLWTVGSGGLPGTEIGNWTGLTSSQEFGGCCGVVTITGISGVSLTAGTSYFMIIGPSALNGTVFDAWNWNNTGATGTDLFSTTGCTNGQGAGCSWTNNGPSSTLGAFDIIGSTGQTVPEPSSLLLLGTGLVGAFGSIRRKLMR